MDDVRILDISRVLAGPWATQQLADQGATVVKVEPPGGDETRRFGPIVEGRSTYFSSINRNKYSIQLDLKTDPGRAVLDQLVDWADVIVENFRPKVAARLGLDWTVLQERRPDLVYVAIHAFGDCGPAEWTGRPGYDIVLQGMGGAAAFTGFPGSPPLKCGTPVADTNAGLLAVQAILLGLLHREKTGEGQRIVVNMLHAQAAALAYHATRYAVTGEVEQQKGSSHTSLVPYDLFPTRDGWLSVACGNDAIWERLCDALDFEAPEAWSTNPGRVAHKEAVHQAIADVLETLTTEQADTHLAAHGIPGGPVYTVDQTVAHPCVETVEIDDPRHGSVRVPGPFFQTATTRPQHRPPPELDEDREAVLDMIRRISPSS